jgi:hypothetical protein
MNAKKHWLYSFHEYGIYNDVLFFIYSCDFKKAGGVSAIRGFLLHLEHRIPSPMSRENIRLLITRLIITSWEKV